MVLKSQDPDIQAALSSCRLHFVYAAVFNVFVNILLLAMPIYMINLFTRVLESRSIETLIALFTGFAIAVIFRGVFSALQSALFERASRRIDRRLSERLVEALFRRRASGVANASAQPLRDLDAYRAFVAGIGGGALLDAPWAALFVAVLFALNPLVGVVAFAAVVVMTLIELAKIGVSRRSLASSNQFSLASYTTLEQFLQGAEAVVGQGMLRAVSQKWLTVRGPAVAAQAQMKWHNDVFSTCSAAASLLFLGLIMAVATVQIIAGEAPPALLFACMILFRYSMRPIQQLISAWAQMIPVRQGLARIEEVLAAVPPVQAKMQLPRPAGELTVKGLTYVPVKGARPLLRNINFGIEPGRSVGIVGLSGSGKTTLARLITGCIKPTAGNVRLDGHDVWDWAQSGERWYVGYLPQTVQILPGTVAENIGHFGEHDEAAIVDAAIMSGAHEMILRLPSGYDTPIGSGGHPISGGQRQLIGLARAVVGTPALVVLDEPNSNLDGPGEDALMRCIGALRDAGVTVVMISHRPNLVRQLDKTVLLKEGVMVAFGETDDVYSRLGRPKLVKKRDAG